MNSVEGKLVGSGRRRNTLIPNVSEYGVGYVLIKDLTIVPQLYIIVLVLRRIHDIQGHGSEFGDSFVGHGGCCEYVFPVLMQ